MNEKYVSLLHPTNKKLQKNTFLKTFRTQNMFPKPQMIVGCWALAIKTTSICRISFGNKYQLHLHSSELNNSNWLVTISPYSQNVKIINSGQSNKASDVIGFMSSAYFRRKTIRNDWRTQTKCMAHLTNSNFNVNNELHKTKNAHEKRSVMTNS